MASPTLTDCYAHFGISVKIPRRLWSAVSPGGTTVVTLWTDHFDGPTRDTTRRSFYLRDARCQHASIVPLQSIIAGADCPQSISTYAAFGWGARPGPRGPA